MFSGFFPFLFLLSFSVAFPLCGTLVTWTREALLALPHVGSDDGE